MAVWMGTPNPTVRSVMLTPAPPAPDNPKSPPKSSMARKIMKAASFLWSMDFFDGTGKVYHVLGCRGNVYADSYDVGKEGTERRHEYDIKFTSQKNS